VVEIQKNRFNAEAPKARRLVTPLFSAAPSAPEAPKKHEYNTRTRIQKKLTSPEEACGSEQKPRQRAEAPNSTISTWCHNVNQGN